MSHTQNLTSQESSSEAIQGSLRRKRDQSSTDPASRENQQAPVSTSSSTASSSLLPPQVGVEIDESWLDDLIEIAENEVQHLPFGSYRRQQDQWYPDRHSNLGSTPAVTGSDSELDLLHALVAEALDGLPTSTEACSDESTSNLESPFRLRPLCTPNASTHSLKPTSSTSSPPLNAGVRSSMPIETTSSTTDFAALTFHSCPVRNPIGPSRETSVSTLTNHQQSLVNGSSNITRSNKNSRYSFQALRTSKEPTLLTLTAFPFRVLYINDAFSEAYGCRKVVGESFFSVFQQEWRETYAFPTIASCPTLLGTYLNEVVRLVPNDESPGIYCKIKVHPVYKQVGRSELGLRYYAVTVERIPTENVVTSTDEEFCDVNSSKPTSIIYVPMSSMSSSIPIKRPRQEGSFHHNEKQTNQLFYLS